MFIQDQTAISPPEFSDSIGELCELLYRRFSEGRDVSSFVVLADEHTALLCLPLLLEHWKFPEPPLLIQQPAGEGGKDWANASKLLVRLSQLGVDRSSVLIALGGGVTTDLGGFLASVYMRGIRFVLLPTSLLAMVDASIGSKSGLDVGGAKNLAGLFCRPELIGIWPGFLKTLPESEVQQGVAEMLKHALIASKAHWESLSVAKQKVMSEFLKAGPDALAWIRESARIKHEIVLADPLEHGRRALLNFGHTVGHAVESAFMEASKPIGHGQAVLFGMRVELILAESLTGFDRGREVDAVLSDWSEPLDLGSISIDRLLHWMRFDKKRLRGSLKFSLPVNIGEAISGVECSELELRSALERLW